MTRDSIMPVAGDHRQQPGGPRGRLHEAALTGAPVAVKLHRDVYFRNWVESRTAASPSDGVSGRLPFSVTSVR
jgi:hypothetical protein